VTDIQFINVNISSIETAKSHVHMVGIGTPDIYSKWKRNV